MRPRLRLATMALMIVEAVMVACSSRVSQEPAPTLTVSATSDAVDSIAFDENARLRVRVSYFGPGWYEGASARCAYRTRAAYGHATRSRRATLAFQWA